jgi:hypothetical protein
MPITGFTKLCICWERELAGFAEYQIYRVV